MIKYQRLKTEKRDNLETISTLKTDVEEYKRQMRFEQTTAQAIEAGLLNKAQILEEYVRVSYVVTAADVICRKVEEYEAAVERLQAEIRMYNQPHTRNPLPPPPEPVPLDRFLPYLQAEAAGMGPYYLNGSRPAPAQAYPSNEDDADDEREPRRSRESKKDRRGKSKAKAGPFYDIYRAISPSTILADEWFEQLDHQYLIYMNMRISRRAIAHSTELLMSHVKMLAMRV